ncbi:MAG: TlpA family protein disulfide reductase [Flavisolibacter sp.]
MKNKVFVAFLILLFASSCSDNKKEDSNATAEKQNNVDSNAAAATPALPSFTVRDINGKAVNLQDLKGKKLFVNFWASWCPPCKRELPSIEKLYKSIDTNKSRFLLVSLDDKFDAALKYISSRRIGLPVYYPMENPPGIFQVQAIPATFIFNEKGDLVKRIDGGENYDTREYRNLFNDN